jgi:hypothetical protein
MKTKFCGLLSAFWVLAALTVGYAAHADAASDARKTITALYMKRDAAEQKKDIQGSLSALAPNFVFITKDGQKGDAKLLKRRISPVFALMQNVKAKSQIQKFAVKGKNATLTVKQHIEMLIVNTQSQAPQKFAADETSEDLWTRGASGWLQTRMKTITETAALDGKTVTERVNLADGTIKKPGGTKKSK